MRRAVSLLYRWYNLHYHSVSAPVVPTLNSPNICLIDHNVLCWGEMGSNTVLTAANSRVYFTFPSLKMVLFRYCWCKSLPYIIPKEQALHRNVLNTTGLPTLTNNHQSSLRLSSYFACLLWSWRSLKDSKLNADLKQLWQICFCHWNYSFGSLLFSFFPSWFLENSGVNL